MLNKYRSNACKNKISYDFQVCYIMVLEHGYITRPELSQHQNYYKKQITNFYFIFVKFSYKQQRESQLYFVGHGRCGDVYRRGTTPIKSFK